MTNKTIILAKKSTSEMYTRELILELFKKDIRAVYRNQECIAQAINKHFGIKRRQSDISKALQKIGNKVINYKGADYHIVKLEEGYMLLKKGDLEAEATQNFADKNMFDDFEVYLMERLKSVSL